MELLVYTPSEMSVTRGRQNHALQVQTAASSTASPHPELLLAVGCEKCSHYYINKTVSLTVIEPICSALTVRNLFSACKSNLCNYTCVNEMR